MAASEAEVIFKQIDTNSDGVLDMLEMTTRLSDFGMSEDQITALVTEMDKDGNGVVDAVEWERGYADYLTALRLPSLQLEVLAAIAAVRADPAQCATAIKERRTRYTGKSYQPQSGQEGGSEPAVKMTKEGTAAVDDALAYLKDKPGLPGFSTEQQLGLRFAGEDHIHDVGTIGVASHVGSDGGGCWDRMDRYGDWHEGACGECLWYGKIGDWVTGSSIVEDLIVDDGVASRGHRLAIYDERYSLAGVSIGKHKVYGNMIAIEFARVWVPDEDKINARLQSGPPSLTVDREARKGEKKTAWNIGKCAGCGRDIEGGQVVEAGGKKYHKECFCCTQCGDNLAGVKQKKEEEGRIFCQP